MSDTMKLWESVDTTDPAITKQVDQRGGFTAICAQAQLKRATELWGPYGKAWGVKSLKWGKCGTETAFDVTLDAVFYSPAGEFEISTCDKWKTGNDTRKKLLTDLTTKALSKLGFNADVFEGKFDDNKYVADQRKKTTGTKKETPKQDTPTGAKVSAKDSAVKACDPYLSEDVDAYLAANSDGQAQVFGDLNNDDQFRWLAGKAYDGSVANWINDRVPK